MPYTTIEILVDGDEAEMDGLFDAIDRTGHLFVVDGTREQSRLSDLWWFYHGIDTEDEDE